MKDVRVCTAASSATATSDCRGNVLISGSYAGEYNARYAAKWGLRGVVLNDAGIGKDEAGVRGLSWLDGIGLPAAAADAWTCHIGDPEHMLAHGTISRVNRAAAHLGCIPAQSVRDCAERMRTGPVIESPLPLVRGGKRIVISNAPGQPTVTCLDAAPMLEATDAGSIVVTGSHAALFRGKPDGVISVDVRAIFFSDAGVGLDSAGITRLPTLDQRGIAAATASVESAAIGDALSIYHDGVMSFINSTAASLGARPGMSIQSFIRILLSRWRRSA
jgi:hypothetical protein